jgi:hypothetical protein
LTPQVYFGNLDGQEVESYTTRAVSQSLYPMKEAVMNAPAQQQIELKIDVVSDVV